MTDFTDRVAPNNNRHPHADLLHYSAENKDAEFVIDGDHNKPFKFTIIDVLASPSLKWRIKPKKVDKYIFAYFPHGDKGSACTTGHMSSKEFYEWNESRNYKYECIIITKRELDETPPLIEVV